MADILEIKNVSKTYNADSDNPVVALDGVDLDIAEGEFVSIIGPSGCGKSTLLNIISGLLVPSEGKVLFDGADVTDLPPDRRNSQLHNMLLGGDCLKAQHRQMVRLKMPHLLVCSS